MIKESIISNLKNVYDPEITSINIYDLGLIYDIDIKDNKVKITHTLTSAFCPYADDIVESIRKAGLVSGIESVEIETTFDPPFDMDKLSEEARLAIGMDQDYGRFTW